MLAVEIGAPHLAFVYSVSPEATVCLNVAPDHVDYFGSFDDYVAVKARAYERTQKACIYNVADPATEQMVRDAEVVEGCRAIGFTLGVPAPSSLGVVEDLLVDRAFLDNRASHAQELCALGDVKPPAPHQVENALAAAALARAHGVPAAAVGAGLRAFTPAAHRITDVGEHDGVRFVDDSKATNWHAALTSLRAYDPVVWIAGGQAKGTTFDDLVRDYGGKLRGAVLLGVSPDSEASHQKFIAKYSLPFPLLVDDDHAVAAKYGAWGEKSMYGKKYFGASRSTFIVDADGVIEGAHDE